MLWELELKIAASFEFYSGTESVMVINQEVSLAKNDTGCNQGVIYAIPVAT